MRLVGVRRSFVRSASPGGQKPAGRVLDIVDRRAPGMDFYNANIDQAQQPGDVLYLKPRASAAFPFQPPNGRCHFKWPARCLFISNMVTLSLPKTLRSLSSARISRRFSGFCRLCERMYSHILLTTCPRDSGREPTTAASSSVGCSGFCWALALPPMDFPVVFGCIDTTSWL